MTCGCEQQNDVNFLVRNFRIQFKCDFLSHTTGGTLESCHFEEHPLLVWVTDYPVVNGSDPRHVAFLA